MNIKQKLFDFVGEVVTLKLTSGEELITKVVDVHDGIAELEEPVSIANGPQGMGLIPSMFTADPKEKVWINTNTITVFCLTEESVKFKYIEATSGLQLPERKIITG